MDGFPWEVLALAALLAVNRLLVPLVLLRAPPFWILQAVNLAAALFVVIFGMPGLAAFPAVKWLVVGIVVFHLVQNLALRSGALHRAEMDELEKDRRKRP